MMEKLAPKPELLANTGDRCGENPLWDDARGVFFWCDIPDGEIYEYNPRTKSHRLVHKGAECGAFTLQYDGNLLLLYVGSAAILNPETGALKHLRDGVVFDTERFNDCIAKPDGSLFAGTVDWSQGKRGGLFDLDLKLESKRITTGTACSNGMAFTPNLQGLYWADSTAKTVYLFDFDEENGLSNRRAWLHTPDFTPDGLTIDKDGNLWITYFDGGFLRHYDADANLVRQVDVPAKHVTSCIFGGQNLDELYITTAGGKAGEISPSGGLYRLACEVGGKREFRTRIG